MFLGGQSKSVRTYKSNPTPCQPVHMELLEDRCVPATLVVNILDDTIATDGDLSLREAIRIVNTGAAVSDTLTDLENAGLLDDQTTLGTDDTIVFDSSLSGGTIRIGATYGYSGGTQFTVTADVVIDGSSLAERLTIDGEDSNRLFSIDGSAGTNVTIDSLMMTQGSANDGGAIRVDQNNIFTLNNSVVTGNRASDDGGGIFGYFATIYIDNSEITLNNSGTGTNNNGGGIGVVAGVTEIRNSIVSGNESGYRGGGIDIIYTSSANLATFSIINSTVSDNIASNDGGGLRTSSANLTILNSTFSGNTSNDEGGGIRLYSRFNDYVIITNTTVSGNQADGDGAGIWVSGSPSSSDSPEFILTNSTVTGNISDADNNGSGDGAGVYLRNDPDSTSTINNSIVAGNVNAAGDVDDLFVRAGAANSTLGTNNVFTTGGVTNDINFNGNSIFVDDVADVIDTVLADNGGPTLTHALVEGSDAIDAGVDANAVDDAMNPLETDQRGVERFINTVDIGAVEYAVGSIFTSPTTGSTVSSPFEVTLENVFDLNDATNINTIENSIMITNGTLSDFVDNGDGTVSFMVTATGTDDVTITAFNNSITVMIEEMPTPPPTDSIRAVGAFEVTVSPDDGTLVEDDITVEFTDPLTNSTSTKTGVVRDLIDNGDGSFTFTVSPDEIGNYNVLVDGESVQTAVFVPLTLGQTDTDFVTNLYIRLFDRNPADTEVEFWVNLMSEGLTKRDVIAFFFASSEFGDGLSNAELIDAIYQEVFNRAADSDYWADQLDNATTDDERAAIFTNLLRSDEASDLFSQEIYNRILHRVAETAGELYWANIISTTEIEDAEEGIADSDEAMSL